MMVSRIIKIPVLIILALMPYSTALSHFSPYETAHSFWDYVVASIIFGLVSLLLAWAVTGKKLFESSGFPFFILGLLIAPPLMLGIPETSPKLLERTREEHFRYGLLLLATFVFAGGFILILRRQWGSLSFNNKLIVIPFVACVVLMLWDSYSSYHFSIVLKAWITNGHRAEDFFLTLNFHELYRTFGRSLLYMIIPWLCFILFSKQLIKKLQMLVLFFFSIAGIAFFFLFNFVNHQFYFPFMIPAIALAPAYWLGLMLLSRIDTK